MKTLARLTLICILTISFCCIMMSQETKIHVVYNGKKLSSGYDMGVNTSGEKHDWLKNNGRELVMKYPDGQEWGAVFITVGKPKEEPQERRSKNFSTLDTLIISMKGAKGGEKIEIGIKDKYNPDDGSETKKTVLLSNEYTEYKFALKDFETANLKTLYVVTEFVFGPNQPCKIFVNSVAFK